FSHERFQDRRFCVECLCTEGFDVKSNRGGDVRHSFVECIPLADHDSLEPQRICDEAVRMMLDDDLHGALAFPSICSIRTTCAYERNFQRSPGRAMNIFVSMGATMPRFFSTS